VSIIRQKPVSLTARVLAPALLGVALLALWQSAVTLGGMPKAVLPGPADVASRLWRDLGSSTLPWRTAVTLGEALAGCLLAAAIALPIGYAVARSRLVEAATSPYIAASQAVPAVALAPLLVVWLGYGPVPIVALCVLVVFFPMLLAAVLGLRGVPRELLEAASLDGASGWRMVREIEWPLARRAVMTGLRNGFTLSITGAVVGEFVMGGEGLGMVVSVQAATNDTTGLFATITVLCALAVAIYLGMVALEEYTDPLRVGKE
jgi:NitT/TauT family transport system permease protein